MIDTGVNQAFPLLVMFFSFSEGGAADLSADVFGFFELGVNTLGLNRLSNPLRLLDTRSMYTTRTHATFHADANNGQVRHGSSWKINGHGWRVEREEQKTRARISCAKCLRWSMLRVFGPACVH